MARAAVLKEYGAPLEIETRDPPKPPDSGVVVRPEACGICRSDWHAWKGHWGGTPPLGHVLGHEPAGEVIATGPQVSKFAVGDKVGVPFNVACGTCRYCSDGHSHLCESRLTLGLGPRLDGAFATEFAVPRADFNLFHLPEGVSPVSMTGLGCRFGTAYHGLAHRADVQSGDWVAVHGCGGLGLSAVHVADALGGRVVAVDIDDSTLAFAEQVGADVTVNAAAEDDVAGAVTDITDGGAAISVDALGTEQTCRNAVASTRKLGRHVQIGLPTAGDGTCQVNVERIVNDEVAFVGVKGMPPHRYDELLELLAAGAISPGDLVTDEVVLEDVSGRLAAMDDFGSVGIEAVTQFE